MYSNFIELIGLTKYDKTMRNRAYLYEEMVLINIYSIYALHKNIITTSVTHNSNI